MNSRSSSSSLPSPMLLPPLTSMRPLPTPGPASTGAASDAIIDHPAKRRRLSSAVNEGLSLPSDPLPSDWRLQPEPRPQPWIWAGRSAWTSKEKTASGHEENAEPVSNCAPEAMSHSVPSLRQAPRINPATVTPSPYVRRKRAVAACQFCRERKTKCDNVRPVCGSCRRHQARCVYADGSEADGLQVGLDEAATRHREVLERLDDIRSLLAGNSSQRVPDSQSPMDAKSVSNASHVTYSALTQNHIGHQHVRDSQDNAVRHADVNASENKVSPRTSSTSYLQFTKCESILKWPSLTAVMTQEDAAIDSFIFDAYVRGDGEETMSTTASTTSQSPTSRNGRIKDHENDVLDSKMNKKDHPYIALCQKFLALVNCRNPILDAHDLLAYARSVTEDGLNWDASSCLVLLACALASFSRAWKPPALAQSSCSAPAKDKSVRRNSTVSPDMMSTFDDEAAKAYFEAARRRLGCLGTSLIDIQCFYFASLFEKFAFRPVQSWMHLQQAATRLRLHHMERPSDGTRLTVEEPPDVELGRSQSTVSFHFEQRAFWSIHKAEREFATELGITLASDLSNFNYPAAFPTPPEMLDRLIASDEEASESDVPDLFSPRRNEFIWFFYLAQISLRRTLDELLALIYAKGEQNWIENIDMFHRQYHESKKQIADWQSHLPPTMRYDPSTQPNNEMGYYLEGRFEEWNESILRPLVYYCLHYPTGKPPSPAIVALAQEYLTLCANCIMRCSTHDRHGGTWFILRRSFRCTLVLLAAVVAKGPLNPPENWQELSRMTCATLKRWSGGIKDLQRMRRVLERVLNAVCEYETTKTPLEGRVEWSVS